MTKQAYSTRGNKHFIATAGPSKANDDSRHILRIWRRWDRQSSAELAWRSTALFLSAVVIVAFLRKTELLAEP